MLLQKHSLIRLLEGRNCLKTGRGMLVGATFLAASRQQESVGPMTGLTVQRHSLGFGRRHVT